MSETPYSAVRVEGLTIPEHQREYPERWLTVHSAWPHFRQALVFPVAAAALAATTELPFDAADWGLLAGWLAHALVVALCPPKFSSTWHLDKRTLWLRFRAWWSA